MVYDLLKIINFSIQDLENKRFNIKRYSWILFFYPKEKKHNNRETI